MNARNLDCRVKIFKQKRGSDVTCHWRVREALAPKGVGAIPRLVPLKEIQGHLSLMFGWTDLCGPVALVFYVR